MTTGAMQRVGGTILFALAPSYAVPCYASGYQDRSFSTRAWVLGSWLVPVGSFAQRSVVRQSAVVAPVALDVADIVRSFRDGGMPVAALAEIARVERKSVYAWLDGGEVRPANELRVRTLHTLLAGTGPDYKALWRVWSRPLASGTSLRALLSSEMLDLGAITSALVELRPAMERHAARDAVRRPADGSAPNPVLSDVPVADFGALATV